MFPRALWPPESGREPGAPVPPSGLQVAAQMWALREGGRRDPGPRVPLPQRRQGPGSLGAQMGAPLVQTCSALHLPGSAFWRFPRVHASWARKVEGLGARLTGSCSRNPLVPPSRSHPGLGGTRLPPVYSLWSRPHESQADSTGIPGARMGL